MKTLAVRSALVVPWLAAALGAAVGAWAQAPASTAPRASAPAAAAPAWPDDRRYAADVASPDTTIAALYDVISGPPGPRDWDRFRNLFAPGARLVPAASRKDGSAPPSLSPEEYVQRASGAFAKNGFFEREVARVAERYGTILHAFSTYESRHAREDAAPFARGINSIQLLQHAGRWWVVTVMWDQERPDNPLPPKYAPGGGR